MYSLPLEDFGENLRLFYGIFEGVVHMFTLRSKGGK
jgi:hypothetical protein